MPWQFSWPSPLVACYSFKTQQDCQNLSTQLKRDRVYICADKISQLLTEAGSAMSGYAMTRRPEFATHFNTANQALPSALSELDGLGPYQNNEAQTIAVLKENVAGSLALLAEVQNALTDGKSGDLPKYQLMGMYHGLKKNGERIQRCLLQLAPADNSALLIKSGPSEAKEQSWQFILTIAWIATASLSFLALLLINNFHKDAAH